jgi:uncharacterized protein YkwD
LFKPLVHLRRLGALSFVVVLASLFCLVAPAAAWTPGAFSSEDEQQLFSLTNQDRAAAGLPALVEDSYLHKKAEWRVQDMGDRDYFSHHIPPDGNMVFSSMQSDGYCFKVAGENIGLSTYGDDATTRIETGFMNSPEHKDNILGHWTRIGVGAYQAADGRKLWAVLFSLDCSADATPKPTPKPTPRPTAKPTLEPTPTLTATPTVEPTVVPTNTFSSAPAIVPTNTFPSTDLGAPTASPAAESPLVLVVRWLFNLWAQLNGH